MHLSRVMNNESPYIRVDRHSESDVAIVAFTHLGYPAGKFAMSNELSQIPASRVYLNCDANSWYQQGCKGVTSSIDETAELLRRILDEINPRKVICVGMSMGGYAALLFGLKIKCDSILVLTAEIIIGKEYSRSYTANRLRWYDYRYRSLQNLIRQNTTTNISAIYGMYDLIDLSLLWPISSEIEAHSLLITHLVSGDHQVTYRLKISDLVNAVIANGKLRSSDISIEYSVMSGITADEVLLYSEVHRLKQSNDHESLLNLLGGHPLLMQRPNLWLWYATAAFDLRQFENASSALKRGIAIDTNSHELHHVLGITLSALRDHNGSKDAYEKAVKLRPNAWMSYHRLGAAYEALGDAANAELSYRSALRLNAKHDDSKFRLDALMRRRDERIDV